MTRQVIVFRPGDAPLIDPDPGQIEAARANRDHLLWIDLLEPTTAEIDALAEEFAFHPLAREDAHHRHQRPKIDQYDDDLFIVFYALAVEDLIAAVDDAYFRQFPTASRGPWWRFVPLIGAFALNKDTSG